MHRIRSWSCTLGLGLCLLGLTGVAGATSAVSPLSIEQLTKLSNQVVLGRVGAIRSQAEGAQIFTYVDVRVSAVWKGDAKQRALSVRLLGGEAAGLRMRVIGGPCISTEEEVVLFLGKDGSGRPSVTGLAEGKFRVLRDQASARVVRDLSGIEYLTSQTTKFPQTLAELERAVRAVK
ncbi:MAG TPA: hypothetical protein VJV78_08140 [Polyangiales bacterium]|nr:hypothetical protein [Polyangiales bacterium]